MLGPISLSKQLMEKVNKSTPDNWSLLLAKVTIIKVAFSILPNPEKDKNVK